MQRFLHLNRRALIHHAGRTRAARLDMIADRRCRNVADMAHRAQFSIARRRQRYRLRRRRAMAGADKHVPPRHMHFYRNASRFRAHGRSKDVRPDRAFAAERAAHERANHAHIFDW